MTGKDRFRNHEGIQYDYPRTEICDLEDLDRGYDVAVAEILDRWEENRRRYLHD